jgi:hypothetical protein
VGVSPTTLQQFSVLANLSNMPMIQNNDAVSVLDR